MPLHDFDYRQKFVSAQAGDDLRTEAEQVFTPLSVFDHGQPELAYAELLSEEICNISGAMITVYRRTRNRGNADEVWDEDADPTYENGVKIKGYFVPKPAESQLTKWGLDTPNQTIVHFSRSLVFRTFGKRMVSEGDVLIVPHNTLLAVQETDLREGPSNRIDRYRVLRPSDTGSFKYRWLYWSCVVENLTGDLTVDVEFRKENS